MALLGRFWRDQSGVLIIKFALMLPVLLATSAYLYDVSVFHSQHTRLQNAADAAALAVAKQLSLTDAKSEDLEIIAHRTAMSLLEENGQRLRHKVQLETVVADDNLTVDVRASMHLETISATFTDVALPDVSVRSAARVVGTPNICVLGLNPSEPGTISLEQDARVTGQNCAVFSNSDHARGLKAKNSSTLSASLICSRGGKMVVLAISLS